nr:ATP-binding protein [Deltaproteobacteria bacterium]
AHLGSWEWHIAEDTLWWSDETYSIFGRGPADFPVSHDAFLAAIFDDDRWLVEQALDKALHGQEYDIEYRIRRPDNSIRFIQQRGKIIPGDGHVPLKMVGSVQDITERKKTEAAQQELRNQLYQSQKLEAIGTMAGGIAHDFNNILGAINGYTELALLTLGTNSEVASHLRQVVLAGNRAKELVHQILTFSRKEKLHCQPMALAAIIAESLKLLRVTIPANIEIRSQTKATKSKIMADPTQIHQIVLNLCTNAHHAMEQLPKGILNIELTDEELNSQQARAMNIIAGPYVKLSISDNGTGIRPEILERIFDPFFTTKNAGKGTGMGLSVVHGIVKSSDGAIIARSTEGHGSTFTIYFPKLRDEETVLKAKTAPLGLPPGHEHILFVDDEPTLIELGQLILGHLGYKVTAVSSSLEALQMLRDHPEQFDLLMTDQSMPQMTGCHLAKEALAIRPDLPVILCSGYGSLMSQQDVKTIGIKQFIRKPYDMAIIAAVLRESLDKK